MNLNWKEIKNQLINGIGTALRVRGSVSTREELDKIKYKDEDLRAGDIYILQNDGYTVNSYMYTGNKWEEIGDALCATGFIVEPWVGLEYFDSHNVLDNPEPIATLDGKRKMFNVTDVYELVRGGWLEYNIDLRDFKTLFDILKGYNKHVFNVENDRSLYVNYNIRHDRLITLRFLMLLLSSTLYNEDYTPMQICLRITHNELEQKNTWVEEIHMGEKYMQDADEDTYPVANIDITYDLVTVSVPEILGYIKRELGIDDKRKHALGIVLEDFCIRGNITNPHEYEAII